MGNTKKQTALNKFISEITKSATTRIPLGGLRTIEFPLDLFEAYLKNARQNEIEQIKQDFNQGMINSIDYYIPNSYKSESEQYYNQTYNTESDGK